MRLRTKAGLIGFAVCVAAGTSQAAPAVTHAIGRPHVITAVVDGPGEDSFFRAVLADLGAPDTPGNLRSLEAWYPHEWPSWPPGAENNPLDSTLPMPGSSAINSVGVQNYPSAAEGARATAETIRNGNYPRIVRDLVNGRSLCGDATLTTEFATWSGGGYTSPC